jgi:nitrate reductase gamma subunit
MENTLHATEERNLNPEQVGALDKRRHRGLMLLVISGQFAIISSVLLLWIGQDLRYSPGWAHPMFYYFLITAGISTICGMTGMFLRRGSPEFSA